MKRFVFLLVCFVGLALMTQGCETVLTGLSAEASSEDDSFGLRSAANAVSDNVKLNWSPTAVNAASDDCWIKVTFASAGIVKVVLSVNSDWDAEGDRTDVSHEDRAATFNILDADGTALATAQSYVAADTSCEVTFDKASTTGIKIEFAKDLTGNNIPHINNIEITQSKLLGLF